jgi:hypothetical protein
MKSEERKPCTIDACFEQSNRDLRLSFLTPTLLFGFSSAENIERGKNEGEKENERERKKT